MEEILVTRMWMGGVVAMMLLFAVIAAVGYARAGRQRPAADQSGSTE